MIYPRRLFGSLSLEVPPGLFPDDEAPEGCVAALTAAVPAILRIRTIELAGALDLADVLRRAGGGPPRQVFCCGGGVCVAGPIGGDRWRAARGQLCLRKRGAGLVGHALCA